MRVTGLWLSLPSSTHPLSNFPSASARHILNSIPCDIRNLTSFGTFKTFPHGIYSALNARNARVYSTSPFFCRCRIQFTEKCLSLRIQIFVKFKRYRSESTRFSGIATPRFDCTTQIARINANHNVIRSNPISLPLYQKLHESSIEAAGAAESSRQNCRAIRNSKSLARAREPLHSESRAAVDQPRREQPVHGAGRRAVFACASPE